MTSIDIISATIISFSFSKLWLSSTKNSLIIVAAYCTDRYSRYQKKVLIPSLGITRVLYSIKTSVQEEVLVLQLQPSNQVADYTSL